LSDHMCIYLGFMFGLYVDPFEKGKLNYIAKFSYYLWY
jgi:hypothetical protein